MKKILLIILIFAASTSAKANIYLDLNGAFTQTNDTKNQYGGGVGLFFGIQSDFNIFIRGIFNKGIKNANTDDEINYSYIMSTLGLEYLFNIANSPFYWKNLLGLGIGSSNVDYKNDSFEDSNDTGLCISAWTGFEYIHTQNVGSFIDIGFHKSFYTGEFKESNIMGVQVLVGARVTLYGKNRSISDGY